MWSHTLDHPVICLFCYINTTEKQDKTTLKCIKPVVFIHAPLLIQTFVSKEFYLTRQKILVEFLREGNTVIKEAEMLRLLLPAKASYTFSENTDWNLALLVTCK